LRQEATAGSGSGPGDNQKKGDADRRRQRLGGIRYRSVQAAYSSQECSQCGFSLSMNRRSQDSFACLWCGYTANADENAAASIAKRFGDAVLNRLPFREVETTLAIRFMRRSVRRFPDARSASAGLVHLSRSMCPVCSDHFSGKAG
jgi:ribosomal protein S27AE